MTPLNNFPYQLSRIVQYLSDPKNIIHFLRSANIADIAEIHDINQYARSDGRKGLVINAKENGIAANLQIFMDLKHGQPSTDQLCEAIYGAGTLSGNRILIFTGTSNDDTENPAANYDLVSRLVRHNDSYKPTYLIHGVVPESANKPLQFLVDTRSELSSGDTNGDTISERNFREFEFWYAFIASIDPDFYKGWSPPKAEYFLNLDYGHFSDVGAFQVREGFNELGAFVWVVQRDGGKDRLISLWREHELELKDRFGDYKMELEYLSGGLSRLKVKISDLPLGWLLGATVTEKLEFARELHRKYLVMVELMREVFVR